MDLKRVEAALNDLEAATTNTGTVGRMELIHTSLFILGRYALELFSRQTAALERIAAAMEEKNS